MRKLKLQVEDLEISTFETGDADAHRGTVVGHKTAPPTELSCGNPTCEYQGDTYQGGPTCDTTCPTYNLVNTCNVTCWETCSTCPDTYEICA